LKYPKKWQLQEAKNKFCQVAEEAAKYGPQFVTKHGKDALVILTMEEYEKLTEPKESLVDFFRNSPFSGSNLVIERDQSGPRDIEL
jgi:prevent-host-death family protein